MVEASGTKWGDWSCVGRFISPQSYLVENKIGDERTYAKINFPKKVWDWCLSGNQPPELRFIPV